MKGLSRREALVFLAKPVKSKPVPKRVRISVVEFLAEMKEKRKAVRKQAEVGKL